MEGFKISLRKFLAPIIWIRQGLRTLYRTYIKILNPKMWGSFGINSRVGVPLTVTRPEKVFLGDYCRINPGGTFIIHEADIYIGKYSVLSYNVTIITGNHKSTVGINQYTLGHTHVNDLDQKVIINEDVWVGAGVTIMPGINVGRGAIVGAGAVVNKDVPPYSIVAGIPAKIIGVKFSATEILKHEKELYPVEERIVSEDIEKLFVKFYHNMKPYGTSVLSEDDRHRVISYQARNMSL